MPLKIRSTEPLPEVTVLIRQTPSKPMREREREEVTRDMACDIWESGGMLLRKIGDTAPVEDVRQTTWDRICETMRGLLKQHHPIQDVHEVRFPDGEVFIIRRIRDERPIPPSMRR